MYVDPDRFQPIVTEGNHPRRFNDLDDSPVANVEGVAGMVSVLTWSEGEGAVYEQTEPKGDNWHRYSKRDWPVGTVRPA